MKKILIAYGALVILVVIIAVAKFNGFNFLPSFAKPTAEINKQVYTLTLAKDEKSRKIGLSNRKSLDQKQGMLFIFPQKGIYSFWMKETEIPLDIIFIDEDKIVYIVKNAKPQEDNHGTLPIYTPPTAGKYVLEINGGLSDKYSFKNGDAVILKNAK